jgi:hypothetical protein
MNNLIAKKNKLHLSKEIVANMSVKSTLKAGRVFNTVPGSNGGPGCTSLGGCTDSPG